MYLEIDEDLKNKIEEITTTDYDFKGNYIPSENVIPLIDDLLLELDRVNEKLTDLENDLENNYRPLTNRELYGDIERF